jgi:hypothetical protein
MCPSLRTTATQLHQPNASKLALMPWLPRETTWFFSIRSMKFWGSTPGTCRIPASPESVMHFFRWLWANQANESVCEIVTVTPNGDRGFDEFPTTESLEKFDASDRKFVAVALASGSDPDVLNAVDSDWAEHYVELKSAGLKVVFLCPAECSASDEQ